MKERKTIEEERGRVPNIAHLVVCTKAAPGLIPHCGPLLHVIPSLLVYLSVLSYMQKKPKKYLKKGREKWRLSLLNYSKCP